MKQPSITVSWRVTPTDHAELEELRKAIGAPSRAELFRRALVALAAAHGRRPLSPARPRGGQRKAA